jgi:hypothetical protein
MRIAPSLAGPASFPRTVARLTSRRRSHGSHGALDLYVRAIGRLARRLRQARLVVQQQRALRVGAVLLQRRPRGVVSLRR